MFRVLILSYLPVIAFFLMGRISGPCKLPNCPSICSLIKGNCSRCWSTKMSIAPPCFLRIILSLIRISYLYYTEGEPFLYLPVLSFSSSLHIFPFFPNPLGFRGRSKHHTIFARPHNYNSPWNPPAPKSSAKAENPFTSYYSSSLNHFSFQEK